MNNKKYILFDLDGTLTDPAEGITNSVAYALKKFGILVKDKTILNSFIGPPLWSSFQKFYGFSQEKSNLAVEYYREYFKDKGIFENIEYNGIKELLSSLKQNKKTLIVATSKPTVFAVRILEYFDLSCYFDFVFGSELDGTRAKKDEVIAYALEKCGIADVKKTVMIGDREHDVIGAKKNGVESIGILYGYGDYTELEQAGADFIIESVAKLGELLLSKPEEKNNDF